MKIVLGGRTVELEEPALGALRRIEKAWAVLAAPDAPEADRHRAADAIVAALTGGAFVVRRRRIGELAAALVGRPAPRRIRPAELAGLLEAVPALCGMGPGQGGGGSGPADWAALYAHLSASLGLSARQIDRGMTLSGVRALSAYQRQHPPVHLLAAAWLGYQPQSTGQDWLKAQIAQFKAQAKKP